MNFNEYQEKAATTAIYLNKVKEKFPNMDPEILSVLGLSYASLGLGETGEVQGKVKKIIRDAGGNLTEETKKEIMAECSDVLWYLAAICTELKIKMNDLAEYNINKLQSRKERNMLNGSGDER